MARPKGQPKLGGREKGTPNKVTTEQRERFANVLNRYTEEKMWDDLMSIELPQERLGMVCKMSEYTTPKLNRTELTGQDGEKLLPPAIMVVSEQTKIDINNL